MNKRKMNLYAKTVILAAFPSAALVFTLFDNLNLLIRMILSSMIIVLLSYIIIFINNKISKIELKNILKVETIDGVI